MLRLPEAVRGNSLISNMFQAQEMAEIAALSWNEKGAKKQRSGEADLQTAAVRQNSP
jgi:hypothetical protein